MSALARYFHAAGKSVSGYDKTATPLTLQLEQEGILVHYDDNIENIPSVIRDCYDKSEVLVVLTPAIPKNHTEWNFLAQNNFTIINNSYIINNIF